MRCVMALLFTLVACAVCSAADEAKSERTVTVTADVATYKNAAEFDHFDDGSFRVYDHVTFRIVTPMSASQTLLSVVILSQSLPAASPLRTAGTRCTFHVPAKCLTENKRLYWGQITQLRVLPKRGP